MDVQFRRGLVLPCPIRFLGSKVQVGIGQLLGIAVIPGGKELIPCIRCAACFHQHLAVQVVGFLQLFIRIGIAGNPLKLGNGIPCAAVFHQLHCRTVNALLGQVRGIFIIPQCQESSIGRIVVAAFQLLLCLQVGAFRQPICTIPIIAQGSIQGSGIINLVRFQQPFGMEPVRIGYLIRRILVIPKFNHFTPGSQQGILIRILRQAFFRLQIATLLLIGVRILIAAHGKEHGSSFLILALLHGGYGVPVADVGHQMEHGTVGNARNRRTADHNGNDFAPLFLLGFINLFPLELQPGSILPGGFRLQGKLMLPLRGQLFNGFPVKAGKHLLPLPVTPGTGTLIRPIGTAADANPQVLLLLWKTHRIAACHVAEHFQASAIGQIVGGIFVEGILSPPPHAGIAEPDLINHNLQGSRIPCILLGDGHREGGRGAAIQVMGAINKPLHLFLFLVEKEHRYLYRGNDFLAQVIQH